MLTGWLLIAGYMLFIIILLAKDEYYHRQEQKRRLDQRAEIQWPVTIIVSDEPLEGETINLSASGALIRCQKSLPYLSRMRLVIKPPGGRQLGIRAEVVRTLKSGGSQDASSRRMAVRFLEISEQDQRFLQLSIYDHMAHRS
ncbi:MAG: PilZ domain-containing protein [Deltaproteobacteria bacterium]|nr:PilZ domain-containing protein [Deltaproteobacteria bacterium]